MQVLVMRQLRMLAALIVVIGCVGTGTAFADAVQTAVTIPSGGPVPVITDDGTGYTPGNYAIGNIQLNYTTVGMTFPTGTFATFRLNLKDVYTSGKTPAYPVSLSLNQVGSDDVQLTPTASVLPVSGIGWFDSVVVTISIPSNTALDPDLNEDGYELLTAKLQLSADSSHLKTTTDILVKIKLVHPTACVKVYDFITDESLAKTVTWTEVNVNKQGKVTSTNPYGSLSHNVMVVNTCGAQESFDLNITLDPWFSTQPNNNPGNAVFTFVTAGQVVQFSAGSFGGGSAQGQNLCLQNVVVPADSTFLATVHTNINNGSQASLLPSTGVFDGFGAKLTSAGSSCGGDLVPFATPNATSAPLSFSIK